MEMSEKGTNCETMQEAATGPKLDDRSFTSPVARGLFDDPEFLARWSSSYLPSSVKFRIKTRGVCAGIDDRENLSQAKRQKPATGGAEPECIPTASLLNDNSPESACSHSSMGLTEMVDIPAGNDICVEVNSPDLVTVGKYQVKPSSKAILERIFHKHGDIAAAFLMLAPQSRSLVLDEVCEIIRSLEGKTFKGLIQCELQRVVDRVRDLERAGLKIGWLLESLEDIRAAYQLLRQAPALKEEKAADSEAVKTKKKEQQELEQKLILVNQELKAAEAKLGRTKESILEVWGRVKPYLRSPLLDGLL